MNIDVPGLLDRTVTVFSRVSAKDAGAEEDQWRSVALTPASWYETSTKTTDADGAVHYSRSVRVQIPATTAGYLPYVEYAQKAMSGDLAGVYTLSLGDWMALGDVASDGVLKAQEVLSAIAEVPHCSVTTFRDLRNNGAVEHPATGCLKYASVVYAEGM